MKMLIRDYYRILSWHNIPEGDARHELEYKIKLGEVFIHSKEIMELI